MGGGAAGARGGAAMEEVSARFVAQKISKARWRPLPAAALQPPDIFATGSWDNEVSGRGGPGGGPRGGHSSGRACGSVDAVRSPCRTTGWRCGPWGSSAAASTWESLSCSATSGTMVT